MLKCLLLFLVPALAYRYSPELGSYELVLRSASKSDKVQIFQSVWGAIRVDFPDDIEKTKALYSQITKYVSGEQQCADEVSHAACELQQEVRRHLRLLASQKLANLLNADDAIANYMMYLSPSLEPALVRDILSAAIDDIFFHKKPIYMAQQLYDLYSENDERSFRIMVEAQLAYYWKFKEAHEADDDYLLYAAHYFHKIMSNHLYGNVDANLNKRLTDAQATLPSSLRLIFSTMDFCLKNKDNDEYLYTTVTDEWNFGAQGRYIFTWHEKEFRDSSAALRAFVTENPSSEMDLHFTFRGELYKWYLYLERAKKNILMAWRSGSPTSTSSFTVKFGNEYLVIKQGDLTVCLGERRDNERRFVKGLPNQTSETISDHCLWTATKC